MRVSNSDIAHIKKTAKSIFGNSCEVYLFGSRVSNDTKGGDLDLLILTNDPTQLLTKKLTFKARVKQLIGDQKIDVIVRSASAPDEQDLIYQEALKGQLL